ncbi:hypothetical protein GMRT_15786 [Giardia muris]|uniref:Uncharacterized protein n=1 Tax=Giardia muris TaxID=5742 RepID=A0A4Z1ST81_GIAMU|nr:hypothetical protein GMRT_15786 [Giardia muris]|eukprot:TNJ29142.1 hypothetical protein GMRT_15786 [Giardia muris]
MARRAKSTIATITASFASSAIRDSVCDSRLTLTGVVPGRTQDPSMYAYIATRNALIGSGCKQLFSSLTHDTLGGLLQYPLRAATNRALTDFVDYCVELALADVGTISSPHGERHQDDPAYWKIFMRDVLSTCAGDLVYDVGMSRSRLARKARGEPPNEIVDTAMWAFASGAATEFVRTRFNEQQTPDYLRAGMRKSVFKVAFTYLYSLLMAEDEK